MGRGLRCLAVVATAWMLVACTGQPGSSPGPSRTPSARLLAGQPMVACTIQGESPVRTQAPALCGTLRVPEDRSRPDGRQIGLRVALIPALAAPHASDPLFVLAGGPGAAGTQFFAWLPSVFTDVHARHDIVLIDQRGTGDSNPVTLPEMPATSGLPKAKADAAVSRWAREALASLDADPHLYTTAVAADDLDAVRAALGYKAIDVYGTSYGGPMTVVDPESGATATIDRGMVGEAIHNALLTESIASQIPLGIHLAYESRYVEAAKIIGAPPSGGPTLMMADEILCSEAWARFDPGEVSRDGAESYALAHELDMSRQRATRCQYLPRGLVPPNDAVALRTDLPVLWLTADGDPQDPPANLAKVPAQQPNSRIVVMPAQQHVVGHLGCLPSVIGAFLDAGRVDRLDTSCVARGAPAPPFRLQ